ncbi:MAG: CBS domain-containing protein [Nakamurella sp.]
MGKNVRKAPARAGASISMAEDDVVTCERAQVTRDDAAPQLVGDVMLRRPKTLDGHATVDEARAFFANPKVISALIVDGTSFVGLLDRGDMPRLLAGSSPIRTFVRREISTITPDRPVTDAIEVLDARGLARMVVLESDGITLAGLLCLDLKRAGFCQG